MKVYQFLALAISGLVFSFNTYAATWQVDSFTYGNMSFQGVGYMTDGQFGSLVPPFVSDSSQTTTMSFPAGHLRQIFNDDGTYSGYDIAPSAPSVNLSSMTIDLSGLLWSAWYLPWTQPDNWQAMAGWAAPLNPIALVANSNGTYTANWVTSSYNAPQGGLVPDGLAASLTISQVPIPPAILLFGSGLTLLAGTFGRIKRKNRLVASA